MFFRRLLSWSPGVTGDLVYRGFSRDGKIIGPFRDSVVSNATDGGRHRISNFFIFILLEASQTLRGTAILSLFNALSDLPLDFRAFSRGFGSGFYCGPMAFHLAVYQYFLVFNRRCDLYVSEEGEK